MLIYIVLHSTKFEQKATPEVKSRVHLAVIVAVILAVNSLFDITLLHSVAMPAQSQAVTLAGAMYTATVHTLLWSQRWHTSWWVLGVGVFAR